MRKDFMTVSDAKEEGIIPPAFIPYFKDTCEYCHHPMIINEAATVMKCGFSGCARRIGSQASDMLHDLGYKDVGPATLTNYCKGMGITSIVDFIKQYPTSADLVATINNLKLSYPKLVELMHFPFLGKRVHSLFDDCRSLQDFLSKLTAAPDQSAFMIQRAGGPTLAVQMVELLQEYFYDLTELTNLFSTVQQARKTVLIAITGHLTFNGGCTKDEFVHTLNELSSSIGVEFRRSDALKSVSYIVADTPSNSRKYRIGLERGIIIDSLTLYAATKKIVDERSNSNG